MTRAGQSIIEYALIFVAIVGVLLIVVPKAIKPNMNQIYNSAGEKMNEAIGTLDTGIGSNQPPMK